MKGKIHSIESFGTVDGPGIRYVLFLQGCPLRCKYCHNPDTWEYNTNNEQQISEIIDEVLRYKSYLKRGGVTVSGGEPLIQIDFVISLFRELKKHDIHTCIDTSGFLYNKSLDSKYHELLLFTDLFLLDIKHIDNNKHIELTGVSNKPILEFAKFLSSNGASMWIRHVLLPGYTDNLDDMIALRRFIETLNGVDKIEVLPYHTMGVVKYEQLNINYPLMNIPAPSKESIACATSIIVKGEIDV